MRIQLDGKETPTPKVQALIDVASERLLAHHIQFVVNLIG